MTTYGDRLYELGGVPVGAGSGGGMPCVGKIWWVDATNGLDSNDGLKPTVAKQTIQAGLDAQSDGTTGLGDIVYVLPGTYAETVAVDDLTNVKLIGASADEVIVAPTNGHGLLVGPDETATATMTNSVIRNMTFLTPSTSNTEYAALTIAYMIKSAIEDCKFKGTTNSTYQASTNVTIGLQIGNMTATSWEFHEHSRISRCEFTCNGGRTQELSIGILVGDIDNTNPSYKGFKSMKIEDCLIGAYDTGILINAGSSSCGGTAVQRNTITSHQGGVGPNEGIVSGSDDGTDALTMVLWNNVTAISDCLKNFSACNAIGNVVAVGGGTPADETMCN